MDHSDHGASNSTMDMDSGMDMGGSCKISMLWNWYTVDTCFLSSTWHNTTKGAFAGSVVGVFILVIAIEALRRGIREYDRYLTRRATEGFAQIGTPTGGAGPSKTSGGSEEGHVASLVGVNGCAPPPFKYTPSWGQQAIRSLAYGSQFTVSFLVMLLGMYYNGYILFAIFIGHTLGYFIFGRDTCVGGGHPEGTGSGHCC